MEFRRLRQATRIHRFYHIIDRMSIIKTDARLTHIKNTNYLKAQG